jgi:hypothetical protein
MGATSGSEIGNGKRLWRRALVQMNLQFPVVIHILADPGASQQHLRRPPPQLQDATLREPRRGHPAPGGHEALDALRPRSAPSIAAWPTGWARPKPSPR